MSLEVKEKMQIYDSGEPIVIKRCDIQKIHDWARSNCDPRDFLLIRLPMKIGLRTREIGTLRKEDISFDDGSFQVLDSKKHRFYPLPLDMLTLELINELTVNYDEGFVFQHKTYKKNKDKPLSNVSIWKTTRLIGEGAGIKGFHPRILRHFFACDWVSVQHKSMEGLRRILRHQNLAVTHRYLARLVFFEDIKKEYDEIRSGPFIEQPNISDKSLNPNYQEWCSRCDHEPICKFLPEFCSSKCAASCKYFMVKEQVTSLEQIRQPI